MASKKSTSSTSKASGRSSRSTNRASTTRSKRSRVSVAKRTGDTGDSSTSATGQETAAPVRAPRKAGEPEATVRRTLRNSITRGGRTYGPGEVDVPESLAESIDLAQAGRRQPRENRE